MPSLMVQRSFINGWIMGGSYTIDWLQQLHFTIVDENWLHLHLQDKFLDIFQRLIATKVDFIHHTSNLNKIHVLMGNTNAYASDNVVRRSDSQRQDYGNDRSKCDDADANDGAYAILNSN